MIAIIVPYFKINFFKYTLASLANQKDKRFEVFIFDDNSPQNPKELLKEFDGEFNFKYHKFIENLGKKSLVKHWERCLDLVDNFDWIMILGDDDTLDENVIYDFYANIEEINSLDIDVVRYSTVVINQENVVISKKYEHPKIEGSIDSMMRRLQNQSRSSLSEHFFRKKNFSNYKIKDLPNALGSDDLMILEHSSFRNIFTINTSLIKIRKSKFNLSGGGIKLHNRHLSIVQFYTILLIDFKSHFSKKQIDIIESKFEREIFIHRKIIILMFFIKYYSLNFKLVKLFRLILYIFIKFPKLLLKYRRVK